MKKSTLFMLITVFIIAVIILTGCTNETVETEPEQTTAEVTEVPDVILNENNSSRFKIIVPDNCPDSLKVGAINILNAIGSTKTEGLAIVYDKKPAEADGFEIVIGNAARDGVGDVKSMLKKPYDYIIKMIGNRIYIYSDGNDQLSDACTAFASMIKNENGKRSVSMAEDVYHSYEYPAAGMKISGIPVEQFSIVYPDGSEIGLEMANEVQRLIYENVGITLTIKKASEPVSASEIIIGNCSRNVEKGYYVGKTPLSGGEYAIETKDGKLICACQDSSRRALKNKLAEVLSNAVIENLAVRESSSQILTSLNNKKVLFLGNSHTYYGHNVTTSRGPNTADDGWFYQIAKTFGEKVTVVNMTYPGEKFTDLYPRLTSQTGAWLESFDAVIMQQAGTANDETALTYARKIRDLFPADTVCVYIISEYCVRNNQTYTLNAAQTLKEEGMLVADWGHTAWDLMDGKVAGMKYEYTKTTFRVNKNDTFHPNPLSGYITALTCYATLTGKKIEGSDYSFIKDSYLNSYIAQYYVNATDTNIIDIFHDKDEITRIQAVIDKRVAEVNNR